ncbi:hypothetical protein Tco_1519312 [Tanacetum coccineum]
MTLAAIRKLVANIIAIILEEIANITHRLMDKRFLGGLQVVRGALARKGLCIRVFVSIERVEKKLESNERHSCVNQTIGKEGGSN